MSSSTSVLSSLLLLRGKSSSRFLLAILLKPISSRLVSLNLVFVEKSSSKSSFSTPSAYGFLEKHIVLHPFNGFRLDLTILLLAVIVGKTCRCCCAGSWKLIDDDNILVACGCVERPSTTRPNCSKCNHTCIAKMKNMSKYGYLIDPN